MTSSPSAAPSALPPSALPSSSAASQPTALLTETSPVRWLIGGLSTFVVLAVLAVMVGPALVGSDPTTIPKSAGLEAAELPQLMEGTSTRGEPGVRPINTPTVLARVNVCLNAGAAGFLILGFSFIRRRRLLAHKRCMLAAFGLSATFLITYLIHHAQVGSVPFRGEGTIRWVYFGLLIPHILLAAAIVPLALFTVYRAWVGRLVEHRKIARYTLPLWLYVSLSGVAVYCLLYNIAGPVAAGPKAAIPALSVPTLPLPSSP